MTTSTHTSQVCPSVFRLTNESCAFSVFPLPIQTPAFLQLWLAATMHSAVEVLGIETYLIKQISSAEFKISYTCKESHKIHMVIKMARAVIHLWQGMDINVLWNTSTGSQQICKLVYHFRSLSNLNYTLLIFQLKFQEITGIKADFKISPNAKSSMMCDTSRFHIHTTVSPLMCMEQCKVASLIHKKVLSA